MATYLVKALAAAGAVACSTVATAHCAADTRGPVFDPEALERGAKALREINESPNAKQVIELARQQEITKQAEAKRDEQKNAATAAQFAAVRVVALPPQKRRCRSGGSALLRFRPTPRPNAADELFNFLIYIVTRDLVPLSNNF